MGAFHPVDALFHDTAILIIAEANARHVSNENRAVHIDNSPKLATSRRSMLTEKFLIRATGTSMAVWFLIFLLSVLDNFI